MLPVWKLKIDDFKSIDRIFRQIFFGGPTWIRTRDQPVMSRELYQLSYGPLLINRKYTRLIYFSQYLFLNHKKRSYTLLKQFI